VDYIIEMMTLPLIKEGVSAVILASAGACPAVPPPEIRVVAIRQPTQVDHTLSREDLQEFKTESDLPLQMKNLEHIETGGVMRGDIGISYHIDMGEIPGRTEDTNHLSCVRYKDIVVTMEIAPKVFVARDYAPDSCWYREILQHEESHIDMDVLVVEKYAQRIEDGLALAFATPGDVVAGPVAGKAVDDLKKRMGENVTAMVDVLILDMARERREKQAVVDSVEGYSYLMNQCYQGRNVIYYDP
jgi:hypothetical protein